MWVRAGHAKRHLGGSAVLGSGNKISGAPAPQLVAVFPAASGNSPQFARGLG